MAFFPIFLSVVLVLRNKSAELEKILGDTLAGISSQVSDFEIIVIDNASEDDSLAQLKNLTRENGFPNIQVYALTKEVEADTASWVGLENALGDFIAVIDPFADDISFLPQMIDKATSGADVVFAKNQQSASPGLLYSAANAVFNGLYKWFNGIHLQKEAPPYRLLSKRLVNFILQHRHPALTYRHLPATGGFARVNLNYSAPRLAPSAKSLVDSIDRGIRLLVSTTRAPLRLVNGLSLFGALANLFYSFYVFAVSILDPNVAPGWASLSLQQSGMFLLLSLVLLILGEYILHMASLSNEGPSYHIAQEFSSARVTRHERLNIEESKLVRRPQ